MREALDDTGDDDVIGRTASLYLSDDYKEVKERVALAWFSSRAVLCRFVREVVFTSLCDETIVIKLEVTGDLTCKFKKKKK